MRLSVEDSIALLQPQKSEVLGRVRHRYEKSNPGEGHLSSQVGAPGKMMLPLCISPNPKVEKVSSQPCTWSGIACPRIFLARAVRTGDGVLVKIRTYNSDSIEAAAELFFP